MGYAPISAQNPAPSRREKSKEVSMKYLRFLVVILLFSILGMQIYFLITKGKPKLTPAPIQLDVESSIIDTISIPEHVQPTPIAKPPTPERVVTKTTINQSKTVYKVDSAKCIGCNLCIPNCPVSAITSKNGVAVIDKDKCIGCGICEVGNVDDYNGCPVSAISKK